MAEAQRDRHPQFCMSNAETGEPAKPVNRFSRFTAAGRRTRH